MFDDLHFIEVVGHDGQPVPPGTPGARVLVTNLFSWAQPLIRYELSDAVTLSNHEQGCELPFQRILSVGGRSDDILQLPARTGGSVAVHPYVLRLPLGTAKSRWRRAREECSRCVRRACGLPAESVTGGHWQVRRPSSPW